tara:strand:- start:41 stop:742 length:702 start_codon:yes stop_codon:yes gene_type:complete
MKHLILISALLFSFNGWAEDEIDLVSAQECVVEQESIVETLKFEVEALEMINPDIDIQIYERLSEARSRLTQEDFKLKRCTLAVKRATDGRIRNILIKDGGDGGKFRQTSIFIFILLISLVVLGYFLRSKFLDKNINQETQKNQDESKEKITNDDPTFLQYLADYYSSIVSILAVLTALLGVVIALVAMFTEEVFMGFLILLGTPLVVILLYGFVAIILEIHSHLKSIDNKLK